MLENIEQASQLHKYRFINKQAALIMMAWNMLSEMIYGKTIDEEYVKQRSESLGPHPVSRDEWLDHDFRFYNDLSDGYKLIETSASDMAKIEELLEVGRGFFASPYIVKTKEENCGNCGRQNNFLDVVTTALRIHKPEFLVNVFTGKYGYIINSQEQQSCICYQCGVKLPPNATKRSSPKPLSAEAIAAGKSRAFYEYS